MGRIAASQDAFRAIADPGRRRILDALAERDRTVAEVTALLGCSQSTASQHLAVLKAAGLVTDRAEGRTRLYHVEAAALRPVLDWVARYERFWTERFERLAEHLARRKN